MTEQGPERRSPIEQADKAGNLVGTVLVRIAVEPGDEAFIARDLAVFLRQKGGSDHWRIELSRVIAALIAGGLASRHGNRLDPTPRGCAAAQDFLGLDKPLPTSWKAARTNDLMATALRLTTAPASRLKLLRKPDGLRALIVVQHWGLSIKGPPSVQRVRSALALKALERAFGNQISTGLGQKSDLPAKAARLLAAQLSTSGREFNSDARLIAALAAEVMGTRRSDLESLQLAVIRRFLGRHEDTQPRRRPPHRKIGAAAGDRAPVQLPHRVDDRPPAVPATAPEAASLGSARPASSGPAARPDPATFAAAVLAATAERAEGWAGNRKAFISKVWALIRSRHAAWALTEIEFKCMLTEAHRSGLIQLANADLKDKRALPELQASAVVWKNTVWHYVRVAS